MFIFFFFFNDTATTEIYTLSLHDALPIFICFLNGPREPQLVKKLADAGVSIFSNEAVPRTSAAQSMDALSSMGSIAGYKRSEEHTSELQSRQYLVCRLLLEKKK